MSKTKGLLGYTLTVIFILVIAAVPGFGAYKAHNSDFDGGEFLKAYPTAMDSKLDNCYLCHTGGKVKGKDKDSCDYCHLTYGFKPPHGDINDTLNSFAKDYLAAGRNQAAFVAIANEDSDGDGFSNQEEILANRLPGDIMDNPAIAQAPAVTFTRTVIRQLPKTTQFMAVDTAKAGDYFATYTGVSIWQLLKAAGIKENAKSITLFAADGYSKTFELADIKREYEQGKFYSQYPWIKHPPTDYANEQKIAGNLRYMIAYERDGYPLQEAKIVMDGNNEFHLDGEGSYRFIAPLTEPVVPDRSQWIIDRDDPPYPYNPNRPVIRNGDFCIKAIVAIRVNDINDTPYHFDWNGRAWEMIEKGELVIYGAINPGQG